MRLIDADAAAADMDPLALVEALRAAHREGGMGVVERLILQAPGSDNAALTWAAWEGTRGVAVKTATIFPGNSRSRSRPNIHSVAVLFDAACGAPLAAIHGERFTRMKTAADSALASALLAAANAQTLAVLGAGGQAATHIRFQRAVRPSIRRVLIWNRTSAAGERLAAALREEGADAEAVGDPETAVRGAVIVTCLTASRDPVLRGRWLSPGVHVDLVGGFTREMRESDDDVVRGGRLFADTLRFTVTECGDFCIPIERGVIPREKVEGDLFDLCSGRIAGRREPDDVTVFKNGGGGHLDLIVARALYDLCGVEDSAS